MRQGLESGHTLIVYGLLGTVYLISKLEKLPLEHILHMYGNETYNHPGLCNTISVGESAGLSIPRSSIRFQQNTKKQRV